MAWGDDEHGQLGNAACSKKKTKRPKKKATSAARRCRSKASAASPRSPPGARTRWRCSATGRSIGLGRRQRRRARQRRRRTDRRAPGTRRRALGRRRRSRPANRTAPRSSNRAALMTWGMNSPRQPRHRHAAAKPSTLPSRHLAGHGRGRLGRRRAHARVRRRTADRSPRSARRAGPAAGGTEVTITGTNFAERERRALRRDRGDARSQPSPRRSVTAIAPAGTGTVDVTVMTLRPGRRPPERRRPASPTWPARSVTKLSAKGGPRPAARSVTITGTGFSAPRAVHFGAAAATIVTVHSATSITAISPANVVRQAGRHGRRPPAAPARSPEGSLQVGARRSNRSRPPNGPLAGGNTRHGRRVRLRRRHAGTTKFKFGKGSSKSVQCASSTSCTVLVPAGKATGTFDVIGQANKAKSAAARRRPLHLRIASVAAGRARGCGYRYATAARRARCLPPRAPRRRVAGRTPSR